MTIRWTQEEIIKLKEMYASTPTKELIPLFGKSKDSITHKARSLNLTKDIHWTPEEDDKLRELYVKHDMHFLMQYLNLSYDAIVQRASTLKIKKGFDFHRHSDLSVLLNDSLVTMYWIGFLLADGTFPNSNGNKTSLLTLILAEKDADHLQKFADYIKLERPIKRREHSTNKVEKFVGYEVSVGDSDRLPQLCKRFGIVSNKTYTPPDFSTYELTTDQWVAVLLGLIDGDGYVTNKNDRCHSRIKCHKSWGPSYQLLSDNITEWAGVKPVKVYYKDNYCSLTLGKRVITKLYAFAIENEIPLLSRKWDCLN